MIESRSGKGKNEVHDQHSLNPEQNQRKYSFSLNEVIRIVPQISKTSRENVIKTEGTHDNYKTSEFWAWELKKNTLMKKVNTQFQLLRSPKNCLKILMKPHSNFQCLRKAIISNECLKNAKWWVTKQDPHIDIRKSLGSLLTVFNTTLKNENDRFFLCSKF